MRFPRFHLATSVVNRILNVADQVEQMPVASEPPPVPRTDQQSRNLDAQLATPPAAVPAPPGSQNQVLLEQQQGGTAADAVTSMSLLESLQ